MLPFTRSEARDEQNFDKAKQMNALESKPLLRERKFS